MRHRRRRESDFGPVQFWLFLLLAFAIPWAVAGMFLVFPAWSTSTFGAPSVSHPLFIFAAYAPALSALLVVSLRTGAGGIRRFLSRLLLWRTSPFWIAFLIFGFPIAFFVGAAIQGNAASAPVLNRSLDDLLPLVGFMLILGPMEEIGWRGLALPLLQRRLVPFWAGMVLGLIWAVWHIPAFLLGGTPQAAWAFMPFLTGSVACSVILTGFFNNARGSILLPMLFHFQMNNPLWPDAQPYDMYIFVFAAAVIVAIERREYFSDEAACTAVLPPQDAFKKAG